MALRKCPSYRGGISTKQVGEKAGVPHRFHTVVTSVTQGAGVDGLLLGLHPIFSVGLLSYRMGRWRGERQNSRGSE